MIESSMRLRIYFHKTDAMRYTGHLDLHHTWERIFRRADLPLAYSQGFHPQPRINLAAALPLGFTSSGEVADVWLEETMPAEQVRPALEGALPPGIKIESVQEVEQHEPTLQTQVLASEYEVTLLDPISGLDDALQQLLEAGSLPRQRRGKNYDLRPLVEELRRMSDDQAGRARLYMRLTAQEGATGRPEEVLDQLGIQPEATLVHRRRLLFA